MTLRVTNTFLTYAEMQKLAPGFDSSNPFKQDNVSSCFKGLKIDPAEKIEIIYSHQIFALLCMRLRQIGKV